MSSPLFPRPQPAPAPGYDDYVQEAAAATGLDPELIRRVIMQESGFNPSARSRTGALGLMQLMPGTAKEMGVTDSLDPRQNILGGARYLDKQIKRFGSNELGAAAYNAGPGNVRKYGGVPPFRETRGYLKNIFKGYKVPSAAAIPAAYPTPFPSPPEPEPDFSVQAAAIASKAAETMGAPAPVEEQGMTLDRPMRRGFMPTTYLDRLNELGEDREDTAAIDAQTKLDEAAYAQEMLRARPSSSPSPLAMAPVVEDEDAIRAELDLAQREAAVRTELDQARNNLSAIQARPALPAPPRPQPPRGQRNLQSGSPGMAMGMGLVGVRPNEYSAAFEDPFPEDPGAVAALEAEEALPPIARGLPRLAEPPQVDPVASTAAYPNPNRMRAIRMPGGKLVYTNQNYGGEELTIPQAAQLERAKFARMDPTSRTMSSLVRAAARSAQGAEQNPEVVGIQNEGPLPDITRGGYSKIEGTPEQQRELDLQTALGAAALAKAQGELAFNKLSPQAQADILNPNTGTFSFILSKIQPEIERINIETDAAIAKTTDQAIRDSLETKRSDKITQLWNSILAAQGRAGS